MEPDDKGYFEKYTLEKVAIGCGTSISKEQLNSFVVKKMMDDVVADQLVYSLQGYLTGKRHTKK
jgi:hypothetical protein